jgi:hypothetical protein
MRGRPAPRRQRFSQAERLQDFQASGLYSQGTRFAGTIRPLIDDSEANTESCQLAGSVSP